MDRENNELDGVIEGRLDKYFLVVFDILLLLIFLENKVQLEELKIANPGK